MKHISQPSRAVVDRVATKLGIPKIECGCGHIFYIDEPDNIEATDCVGCGALYEKKDGKWDISLITTTLRLSNEDKSRMLQILTIWANSDEGQDFRAGQAHAGSLSPVTAEDVLSYLECVEWGLTEAAIDEVREDLGMIGGGQ